MTARTQKPKRKIVQIAAIPETKRSFERLYALCDDNTILVMNTNSCNQIWRKIDPIPEEDAP